jgi:hypothetical protein
LGGQAGENTDDAFAEAETIKAMTAVDRLMKKEKTDSISDLHTVDED